MSDTIKKIHLAINGMAYREEIPEAILQLAKKENILIAYGCSDDLLELRGFIDDELGAFNGWDFKELEQQDEINFVEKVLQEAELVLLWAPTEQLSWSFKLGEHVEYCEFNIIEDGEVTSKGVIVQLK